jgi:hypothetical protein
MRFVVYLLDHAEDHKVHRENDKHVKVDDFEPFQLRVDVGVACRSSWDILNSAKKVMEVETYASWRTPAEAMIKGDNPILARIREA